MSFVYMFLILVFAIAIVPGALTWLGLPTPSEGISNMFTALLGEPSLVNNLIVFSLAAGLIALVVFTILKVTKKMENAS